MTYEANAEMKRASLSGNSFSDFRARNFAIALPSRVKEDVTMKRRLTPLRTRARRLSSRQRQVRTRPLDLSGTQPNFTCFSVA